MYHMKITLVINIETKEDIEHILDHLFDLQEDLGEITDYNYSLQRWNHENDQ